MFVVFGNSDGIVLNLKDHLTICVIRFVQTGTLNTGLILLNHARIIKVRADTNVSQGGPRGGAWVCLQC